MGRFYADVIIGGKIVIYDPINEVDYVLDTTSLAALLAETTPGNGTFYRDIIRTQNLVIGDNSAGYALTLADLISAGHAVEYTVPEDGAVFYRDTILGEQIQIGNRDAALQLTLAEFLSAGLVSPYGNLSSETGIVDTLDGLYITSIGANTITVKAATTVEQLLDSVDSSDGSNQVYTVTDNADSPKTTGSLLTGDKLVVTASDLTTETTYVITVAE